MRKSIKIGSMFSGVGAFEQSLNRLGINYENILAADMDKYARQTYLSNYEAPKLYAKNVYDVDGLDIEQLDLLMLSPPCQAFSLAGKRKGEDDERGVLFYNSHEFITKNKPRYFIFENVKGLLSAEKGRTFQVWLDMLGGKSVNGNPVIFPREDATPYHIYHRVLNAKNYGVPQNRERVFIIGIRDDADNTFNWPQQQPLKKRLKDVLESEVDAKYYLSDKMMDYLQNRSANFNNGKINYKDENDTASCITKSSSSIDISDNIIKVGNTNPSGNGMNGNIFDADGICPTLSTNKGEGIKVKQNVMMGAIRGRNPKQPKSRVVGLPTEQMLELNMNGTSNALTTVQKDNVVVYKGIAVHPVSKKLEFNGFKDSNCPTLLATDYKAPKCVQYSDYAIRRLTPRECFRLMDFPDTFKMPCSNSQMYKQAGNSIVVNVLAEIIKKLELQ